MSRFRSCNLPLLDGRERFAGTSNMSISLFLRVAHLLIPECSLPNKKLETRLYSAGLFLPKELQNLPNL
jgi:hypothetical protein